MSAHQQILHKLPLTRTILILIIASMAAVSGRPSHFGENNQLAGPGEQELNNLLESGVKPWQLEAFLAQRLLAESNNQPAAIVGNEFAWERAIRSPENKRQSRYRQCYFNPISCFRK